MNLEGKKIALIAPDMYDYAAGITAAMESHGAEVTYFRDRPQSLLNRISRNMTPAQYEKVRTAFLEEILSGLRGKQLDFILIIKGTALTGEFAGQLKAEHPHTRIIMYQWDFNELHPYLHLVEHMDATFVFDASDLRLHPSLKYLPLFYRDSYVSLRDTGANADIDLLHIGTLHEGKYKQIMDIEQQLKGTGLKIYWYLFVTFSNWFRRLLKGERYFKVKFFSLNNTQILDLYRRSRAVLDLPMAGQKGLTMRTFEVLGSHKKLVTTNPTILAERIYSPELVYVLGHDRRSILDFLKQEVQITDDIKARIEGYSIHRWLETLFTT